MTERCKVCGADLGLVGRVHRCVPVRDGTVASSLSPEPVTAMANAAADGKAKYPGRNAEKWRAYMRGYMRKRRLEKKEG